MPFFNSFANTMVCTNKTKFHSCFFSRFQTRYANHHLQNLFLIIVFFFYAKLKKGLQNKKYITSPKMFHTCISISAAQLPLYSLTPDVRALSGFKGYLSGCLVLLVIFSGRQSCRSLCWNRISEVHLPNKLSLTAEGMSQAHPFVPEVCILIPKSCKLLIQNASVAIKLFCPDIGSPP